MKKTCLLFIAAALSINTYAQRAQTSATATNSIYPVTESTTSRTTAAGDTRTLTNIAPTDTLVLIKYTSKGTGYVAGTNSFNDKGFAERYDFNGNDSSMKVTGVMARFGGKVVAASTKAVNLKVWNTTNAVTVSGTVKYHGFPNGTLNTKTVPVTNLGISASGTTDTMKSFSFDTASKALSGPFFIGYDIAYNFASLAGDTIGLASTANGRRTIPLYHLSYIVGDEDTLHIDTIIHVQNATQYADNIWHENFTDNDSVFNNLAIFPIVLIGNPTGINSVVRNNLSLFGNYPNPATNNTNIKFALAQAAEVTIKLVDMTGKEIANYGNTSFSTGTHTLQIPTNTLAAGNYIYTIQTSSGDAIAGQMSVTK